MTNENILQAVTRDGLQDLPPIGSKCEVAGANSDGPGGSWIYNECKVMAYSLSKSGYNYGWFQKEGCWPFQENLANCKFRNITIVKDKPVDCKGSVKKVWFDIKTAPKNDEIIGKYGDSESLIRWAEKRVCMLAGVGGGNGHFGEGWECVENKLIIDEPEAWRPVPQNHIEDKRDMVKYDMIIPEKSEFISMDQHGHIATSQPASIAWRKKEIIEEITGWKQEAAKGGDIMKSAKAVEWAEEIFEKVIKELS